MNGSAVLTLSADTLSFDTVFTTTGSVTQQVKLINNNNQSVGISSISLAGGTGSPFIINIDGTPGPNASNLNIQANDSLYIFVTVLIPSGVETDPFFTAGQYTNQLQWCRAIYTTKRLGSECPFSKKLCNSVKYQLAK